MGCIANTVLKASRFTGDAAGLEKTLRLFQNFAQVVAGVLAANTWGSASASAAPWLKARDQLALGRRYLRVFNFINAFNGAFIAFNTSHGFLSVLETSKWSCLGMFLILESSTILDAMGVWPTTWAPRIFVESMRFWFYALFISLVMRLLELYQASANSRPSPATTAGQGVSKNKSAEIQTEEAWNIEYGIRRKHIMKQLVIDCCDILIPGSIVGWFNTSSITIGMMTVISTLLSSGSVWDRV